MTISTVTLTVNSMKISFLFCCLVALVLLGCCKKSLETSIKIQNTTSSNISIQMYKNGKLSKILNVILKGASGVILDSTKTKLRDALDFSRVADSVVVAFDNQKKAVHYDFNKTGNNPFAILFKDKRCLFNELAYESKVIIDDRCYAETEFVYTFVEQDYLNAK